MKAEIYMRVTLDALFFDHRAHRRGRERASPSPNARTCDTRARTSDYREKRFEKLAND